MASGNETTTNFKVDISELKKGIQEANRQIKLANAEFKAAASSMDDWQKSTDGVQKKIDQLRSVLTSQKTILESYKKQLALISAEYGENSKEADEMRIKIANQQAVVNNTERSIRNYTTQLEELERAQQEAADSAEEQANASETLTEKVKRQQDALKDLKQRYVDVVAEQGANSDEAKALAHQIENLSGELNENETNLREAQGAADSFDRTMGDLEESTEEAGGGFSVFKGVLADLVASGIKAAISGLKDLASAAKEAFQEFDEGRDAVIKATGATGDAAKDLQKSYAEVAKSVVGDFGDIGSALGEVNTRFGYTGSELETATKKFMKFSEITGTDATSAVQLVSRAMGDAGIESSEYAAVLDDLAIAAQASGISVDKLTELLTKYGAPMRALGFETKDAIAIFSQWEKAGVNTEIAFSGMKTAISNWSAEGKNAKEEFQKILDEIAAAPDIASATTKAIEVFGKKAGPDLADAIQGGRFEYSEFLDLLEGSEGTVENTFDQTQDASDKVKLAFQTMKVSLGETVDEIVQKYGPDIENAINAITPVVQNVVQWFAEKIPPAIDTVKSAFEQIAPFAKGIYDAFMPIVQTVFGKLFDIIKSVFGWIIDNKDAVIAALAGIGAAIVAWNIATVVTNIVKMVKALKMMGAAAAFSAAKQWLLNTALFANPIGLVVAAIAGLVTAFIVLWKRSEKFRNFWLGLWEKIKTAFSGFVDAWGEGLDIIKEALSKVGEFFNGIWDSIQESASSLIENVVGFFSGAWEKIKSAWNASSEFFSGVWEGIKEIFSAAIQAIIEFFQPAIDFFTAAWNIIAELAEGCWNLIKAVWSVVAEWFKTHIIQPVAKFFSDLWEAIKTAASTAWDFIKHVWAAVSNWFNVHIIQPVSQFFSKMWDGIKNAASTAWNGIKSVWNAVSGWFNTTIIQPVAKFFTGMWDGLKKGASDAWDGIKSVFSHVSDWFKDVFSKAWQKVKDVFSTGGKVFDGIKDGIVSAFKTVVNAIIRGINKVIAVPFNAINGILDKIQSVSIAGIQPFEGLVSRLPVPEIPQLAQGGVLKRGQVGLLEGNGAEAVVPLENNKRWIAVTAAELKRALISEGILGARSEVITNNYNFTQNNTSPKALSRLDIYRQSKNLLSLKGAT